MKHPEFTQKEISHQAGLSLATIDRVLNCRAGVRLSTVTRVNQALRELRDQQNGTRNLGHKYMLDLVAEAPLRFTDLLRAALENEFQNIQPAVFRCRFHLNEIIDPEKIAKLLRRIALKGSNGVLLKAPDHPAIIEAIDLLDRKNIPVITLVTDIPFSKRLAYVGIDNRAAGETAAYLIGTWLPKHNTNVLVTLSSSSFRGEEEREAGFRKSIRNEYPHLNLVEVSGGFGRDAATTQIIKNALLKTPAIDAVYSVGGANQAVLQAFHELKRDLKVFIGHDLDEDNTILLRERKINAVLHHNLKLDMQYCCRLIMQHSRIAQTKSINSLSPIQVITPFNIPYS